MRRFSRSRVPCSYRGEHEKSERCAREYPEFRVRPDHRPWLAGWSGSPVQRAVSGRIDRSAGSLRCRRECPVEGAAMSVPVSSVPRKRSYSDIVLAAGVVAIVALMILPLPTLLIDVLVALNILIGVGLLLLAIYIPSPVAFSSFPSVLLITTLFRLSLSIAITRKILLEADGGHIIDTFGNMVVGGNLVVGVVIFLIITVVQFIVVAKGAERVAEVAARFTLDAMPGKQLSIDSDLRSGLIDKDEARRRRRLLESESQLHGSLDGAMKFVKGDAVAGIVIIIVNLLG